MKRCNSSFSKIKSDLGNKNSNRDSHQYKNAENHYRNALKSCNRKDKNASRYLPKAAYNMSPLSNQNLDKFKRGMRKRFRNKTLRN